MINLSKKSKNRAQFSSKDQEIILNIVIKLVARIQMIIELSNSNKDYIQHLVLNSSKNKQRTIHTIASLMTLQGIKDYFLPQEMRKKIIDTLNSISFDTHNIHPYVITKILHELQDDALLENIRTKKRIKENGFSKHLKELRSEGGGYPSLYSTSHNIKEYRRILGNENAIKKINEDLKKCIDLNQFYTLICEAFMKIMISNSNSDELRKTLELIAKTIGYPVDKTPADFSNWDMAVEGARGLSDEQRKNLCSDFVTNMMNNPNSLVLICFVISL